MSTIDGTSAAQAAAMVDAARQLRARAGAVHDLVEQARRELDRAQYQGPAADADRSHLAHVCASVHGLGNALDELAAAVLRASANLP
jgi:uncharacterized protein YukE